MFLFSHLIIKLKSFGAEKESGGVCLTNAAAYGIVRKKKKDCVLPPGKRERRDLCRQATADIKLPAHFL